jgi:hypothetical protein
MDRMMDHVGGGVEVAVLPAINHLALLVHEDEIAALHQPERRAKRIHPEVIWIDRIPQRDVPSYALFVA